VESFAGRHTSRNIAAHIDKQILELRRGRPDLSIVLVHDAARNMEGIQRRSDYLESSITCLDHLLNTSLGHAVDKVDIVHDAVTSATQLSSRLHQSVLACYAVKDLCTDEGVKYKKVITPVIT